MWWMVCGILFLCCGNNAAVQHAIIAIRDTSYNLGHITP
jgi:hypothetical protein